MRIVFLAAEMAPLAKVGGLADVVGSLPPALRAEGCDVEVFLPFYGDIDRPLPKEDVSFLHKGKVELLPGQEEPYQVFRTAAPDSGIAVYLVRSNRFFSRPGVYTDPDTGGEYGDAPLRYLFFCKAVLAYLAETGGVPDVLHTHDSHTAPALALMRTWGAVGEQFAPTSGMLTIHNIAYQGICHRSLIGAYGVPESHFFPLSPFEYFGQINALKIGILFADSITTVSERYAREICELPEYGCGLEGILRQRRDALTGILNGIDEDAWDPALDELTAATFSAEDLSGKALNKAAVLRRFGFAANGDDRPLIGMIGRLVDQKGIDLVVSLLPELAGLNLRLVLLGTGLPKYELLFREAALKYPDFISVHIGFDNRLAHLIEAGADMFLMPSRFEPCGLNQMYSMRYGTAPIVRETGGLADTVGHFDPETGEGTGFVFQAYTAESLRIAIHEALDTYQMPSLWQRLIRNAMSRDFSWRESARKYKKVYEAIVAERNPK